MNYHLSVNSMLREVFELGSPLNILDAESANKLTKIQRVSISQSDLSFKKSELKFLILFQNAANQYAFKMRTQVRSKNRDKRSAIFQRSAVFQLLFKKSAVLSTYIQTVELKQINVIFEFNVIFQLNPPAFLVFEQFINGRKILEATTRCFNNGSLNLLI